jgi:hypothetical protein
MAGHVPTPEHGKAAATATGMLRRGQGHDQSRGHVENRLAASSALVPFDVRPSRAILLDVAVV